MLRTGSSCSSQRAALDAQQPRCFVIDPLSAIINIDADASLRRLPEQLLALTKAVGITLVCTSLLSGSDALTEGSSIQVSTVADTWIHISYAVLAGERNRALTIIKSRGTEHSNQVRELILDASGITLADDTLPWARLVATIRRQLPRAGVLAWRHEDWSRVWPQVLDAMVVAASHAPPFDTSRPALLAQCYSRAVASDVKLTLLHSFPLDHPVAVLRAAGTAAEDLRRTPLYALDRSQDFDHLTTLYLPPISPHGAYSRLQEIVAHLRAPNGCPWDREQTMQTLRKDLLEETYELLEALDEDDDEKAAEELGDLTLIVAMLAQIASEEEHFQWPRVMELICDKLIRRHPHVFGDVEVSGVEDVLANWAAIKEQEASGRSQVARSPGAEQSGSGRKESILDSVPKALPALMLASKYQSRLARAEIEPELAEADPIGVALWNLVSAARGAGVDAETVLRDLCRQVADHVE